MAAEDRSQYEPSSPPKSVEGIKYIFGELQAIANSIRLLKEGKILSIRSEEPRSPKDGQLAIADGSGWDPGNGKGLYWYEEASGSWQKV